MIKVDFDDRPICAVLGQLADTLDDMQPALREMGEVLLAVTKRRFVTSTAPDGSRWAPNTPTTYDRYLAKFRSNFTKTGKLSSKGAGMAANKRPSIGETRIPLPTLA